MIVYGREHSALAKTGHGNARRLKGVTRIGQMHHYKSPNIKSKPSAMRRRWQHLLVIHYHAVFHTPKQHKEEAGGLFCRLVPYVDKKRLFVGCKTDEKL